jgi:chaperonin cofactor prefoldin
MTVKSIESRIREYYVSESGEWLVEKGKVKEAKLLKEACETIEWLRRQNNLQWQQAQEAGRKLREREDAITAREKTVEQSEKSLRDRLESVRTSMEYLLEKVK